MSSSSRQKRRSSDRETKGDQTTIDFDVKNNGRGPTIAESITLDTTGLPSAWTVKGTSTFGSKIAEHLFARACAANGWTPTAGPLDHPRAEHLSGAELQSWSNGITRARC